MYRTAVLESVTIRNLRPEEGAEDDGSNETRAGRGEPRALFREVTTMAWATLVGEERQSFEEIYGAPTVLGRDDDEFEDDEEYSDGDGDDDEFEDDEFEDDYEDDTVEDEDEVEDDDDFDDEDEL